MKRFVSWIVSSLGYLLYTAFVLVVMLWILFPAEKVRVWVQARLNTVNPALQWEIKGLQTSWPLSLVASGIRLVEDGGSTQPLLQIDSIKLTPGLSSLYRIAREIPVHYQIRMLEGNVRGTAAYSKENSQLRGSGNMLDLNLALLAEAWQKMGRVVTGKLSGRFSYEGQWEDFRQSNLQAELDIGEGSVSLQQPIFGLDDLAFNRMATSFTLQDSIITLERGEVESRMMAGEFSGTVSLADTLMTSEVKIDGSIEPRPELLGGLPNKAMMTLIKNQLQDDRLSFAMTGTLLEPGIVFRGATGVIDGIIEGGVR